MSLFSFLKKKYLPTTIFTKTKDVASLNLSNLKNLKEHDKSIKELINGFYTVGTSISSFKLSIEFFQKNIFSKSENLNNIFSLVIENTNNASDKISNIFSDLEADNGEKLKKISSVIVRVQESLEAINKFLGATNMVSLNAKLEAARAREYGKGFSVVADEIKRLSDQAKGVMSMILVREIEEVSKDLISKNLDDLKNDIHKFFTSILEQLEDLQVIFKKFLSFQDEFESVLSTLESIENNIVSFTQTGGSLLQSKAFMISNYEFLQRVDAAVSAHITWVERLRDMVQEKKPIAIQTDGTKCGFGLFYNSVVPKDLEIKKIWLEIKEPHLDLHKTAVTIISIFDKNHIEEHEVMQARDLLKHAEHFSHEVIRRLEDIKNMVVELNEKKINIFG